MINYKSYKKITNKLIVKFLVLVTAVGILPLILTSIFLVSFFQELLIGQVRTDLSLINNAIGNEVLLFIDSQSVRASDFATDSIIINSVLKKQNNDLNASDEANLLTHLTLNKLPVDENLVGVEVVDSSGKLIVSTISDQGPVYKSIDLNIFETEFSDVFETSINGVQKKVFASVATINSNDQEGAIGYLINYYSAEIIQNVLEGGYFVEGLGPLTVLRDKFPSLKVYLISSTNSIIASNSMGDDYSVNHAQTDAHSIDVCMKEGEEVSGVWKDHSGQNAIGHSSCLSGVHNWRLVVEVSEESAFVHIESIQKSVLLIVSVFLAAIIFTGISTSKSITGPLTNLTTVTDGISKGDLRVKIDQKTLNMPNEIGELAQAFDRTLVSLKLAMKMTAPALLKEKQKAQASLDEHKKLLEDLKDSTYELEEITKVLHNSSLVAKTDLGGNITYVNNKFVEISKYTEAELIGKNHRILKSGFHSPKFYKKLWTTISSGNIWRGELRNKAKDGSIYWVRSVIMPIFGPDKKVSGYVAVRTPITDALRDIEMGILTQEKGGQIDKEQAQLIQELRHGEYSKDHWGYNWLLNGLPDIT